MSELVTPQMLRDALENMYRPGALDDHPILRTSFIQDFLQRQPGLQSRGANIIVGRACYEELVAWSDDLPLSDAYNEHWLQLLSLIARYFRWYSSSHALQKPRSFSVVGGDLIDGAIVASLIPGHESERKSLYADYRAFFDSFEKDRDSAIAKSTVSDYANQGIAQLTDRMNGRYVIRPVSSTALSRAQRESPRSDISEPASSADSIEQTDSSALSSYRALIDRAYPLISGYKPPAITVFYRAEASEEFAPADMDALLAQHATIVVSGRTGAGKSDFVMQVLLPAAWRQGLIPVPVSLPDLATAGASVDLVSFAIATIAARGSSGSAVEESAAQMVTQAARDRRLFWLLDGYDELTASDKTQVVRQLDTLDRMVLVTRTELPLLNRPIDIELRLGAIAREDALDAVGQRYAPAVRSRLETRLASDGDFEPIVRHGLLLDAAARIASQPAARLTLYGIANLAIDRLMSRSQMRSGDDENVPRQVLDALGGLGLSVLARQRLTSDFARFTTDRLMQAGRGYVAGVDRRFVDLATTTGLVVGPESAREFCHDLIRDALVARLMDRWMALNLDSHALYPQYQRVFILWCERMVLAGRHDQVAAVLERLLRLEGDPYGARWAVIVPMLEACAPYDEREIGRLRSEIEQALLDLWNSTTSISMKLHVRQYLTQIGSVRLPAEIDDDPESVLVQVGEAAPLSDLRTILLRAGRRDLADGVADSPRLDDRTITDVLIDTLASGDAEVLPSVVAHLADRNLQPTMIKYVLKAGPINRLAVLAESRPVNPSATQDERRRARLAQSAALSVLAQPRILGDKMLLKAIPTSVVHTLMATCDVRIRLTDDGPIVITADGREWPPRPA